MAAVRVDELPMPARVAARPRDVRGYPVPAITPWHDGAPQFALTSLPRTYICAAERRCSICGEEMEPGPVWRVLAGPEAQGVVAAQAAGHRFLNRAPTGEAPGHRACMLYAAVTCPYLARPTARRGQPAEILGLSADRGGSRGVGGAVAAFEQVEFQLGDVVMFRLAGLTEFLPHELGSEQAAELAADMAATDPLPTKEIPAYLLADEGVSVLRFNELRKGLPTTSAFPVNSVS